MANRYWVGGSGIWNTTSTTNWSTASGGVSGASAPSVNDIAIFDANSGSSITVTLGSDINVQAVNAVNAITSTLDFGPYTITLNGNNGTIWACSGFTTFLGTPNILATYSGAIGTRIISPGGSINNPLSVNITNGSDTVRLSSGSTGNYGDINFTGFSGSFTFSTTTGIISVYGSLTLSIGMTMPVSQSGGISFLASSGTKTIVSNGKIFNMPLLFGAAGSTATWQLVDNMTVEDVRTISLYAGTLDLNGNVLTTGLFNGSSTITRTLNFNAGRIDITGLNATVFTINTLTGLTILPTIAAGGSRLVRLIGNGIVGQTRVIGSGSGGTIDTSLDWQIIAGSDTVNLASARSIDFNGFSGSWGANARTIYAGNLTLSAAMTCIPGAVTTIFASTSGTQHIVTNGVVVDFPVTFSCIGGAVRLIDALTLGSNRNITLTNGNLDLNGNTLTASSFITAAGTKSITFNGGIISLSAVTTTAFNNAAPTNFSTTAGTAPGTISMTGATAKTFVGGGRAYAATLNQGGAGTLTITGANTFESISNSYSGASNIILPANTTTTISGSINFKGSVGNLVSLNSSTSGTKATLAKINGIADCDYINYKDTDVTGGYWYSGTNSIDSGNNTGWTIKSAAPHKSGFWPLFMDIINI